MNPRHDHRDEPAPASREPEHAGGMLSIGALSRATGIPIETLRTWERRYGFPVPERKPSGHRLYPIESVPRLRRIGQALAEGHRAGEVVPASDEDLARLIEAIPQASEFPGPRSRGSESLTDEELIEAVLEFKGERLMRALLLDWARMRPVDFLAERVAPLIRSVGQGWAEKRLDVRHEHFLSERLGDLLRSLRMPFEERANGPLVVMATLPGELHGLGLQMTALLFASHGFRLLYLGTDTPVDQIASLAKDLGAAHVALSVSVATGGAGSTRAINRLRQSLPDKLTILVGGEGARPKEGIVYLRDLRDLHEWCRSHGGVG